jgi:hypothetical protein
LRPEEHRGHGEGHGRVRGPRGKVRRSR